jgi:hypothetical protein
LKEQLLKDLNWKRPIETTEAIEIGPITFKEESKRGDDTKRKQVVYLIDSEVYFSYLYRNNNKLILSCLLDNPQEDHQI